MKVDARGLLCPMPVVMVQKAVKDSNPNSLEVVVDDPCAVENITRFGNYNGYQVESEDQGDEFVLRLNK